jgi:hypothetical protein
MKTVLVEEHTIVDIEKCSGMVLDVGCRHFDFTKAMIAKGYHVISLEADDTVIPWHHRYVCFVQGALVPSCDHREEKTLIRFGNGTANHLSDIVGGLPSDKQENRVMGYSIAGLCSRFDTIWDVVKLDCEGSEYAVLLDWPGPVARQITVEFHEHTNANTEGPEVYDRIMKHLGQWYDVVQHDFSCRHGIRTPNYWDSLFILKPELLKA